MTKSAVATAELSSSLEDYLEAIYHIVEDKGAARPKDIAKRLDVGSSSVTGALKALAERLMVNYAPYDVVTLTQTGQEVARDVVHRHSTLRKFFMTVLAVEPELADTAACQVEHTIPPAMVERLVRFIEFIEMCPRGGPGLIDGFRHHLEAGCRPTCFDHCPLDGHEPIDLTPPTAQHSTLADLEPGQTAVITRLAGDGALRRRLMDLGLIAETRVRMERTAPLGDPIEIVVKGTHLSLRRHEAATVFVKTVA